MIKYFLMYNKYSVFTLPIICWIIFIVYQVFYFLPLSEKELNFLSKEIHNLSHPQNAIFLKEIQNDRLVLSYVNESFTIDRNYEQVYAYYDEELLAKGWALFRLNNSSKNSIVMEYCKDGYTTTISYYPVVVQWKYDISLSWGGTCASTGGPILQYYSLVILFVFAGVISCISGLLFAALKYQENIIGNIKLSHVDRK
jgi:hypothetical protein